MKYLENLQLETISNYLSNKILFGGRKLNARIEVYTTKRAGDDKKVYKAIEQRILRPADVAHISASVVASHTRHDIIIPDTKSVVEPPAVSPIPSMGQKSAIKLHVDLIQTLNSSLIDYDFSELSMKSFKCTSR